MFADWSVATTDAQCIVRVFNGWQRVAPSGLFTAQPQDTPVFTTPLLGSGSLLMHVIQQSRQAQIWRTAAPEHGFLRGRIRTHVWIPVPDPGLSGFGLYCLANQERLIGTTGRAIVLSCHNLSFQHRCELGPVANGLETFWGFPGVDSPTGQWSAGRLITMELAWEATPAGTCVVTYMQGTQPDFSDLALILAYSGAMPVPGVAVGEGLWVGNGTGSSFKVVWDQTTIESL